MQMSIRGKMSDLYFLALHIIVIHCCFFFTQNMTALAQKKKDVEAEQRKSQALIQELSVAKEQLLGQVRSLESQISTLNNTMQQSKSQEKQLREHLDKLMVKISSLPEEKNITCQLLNTYFNLFVTAPPPPPFYSYEQYCSVAIFDFVTDLFPFYFQSQHELGGEAET